LDRLADAQVLRVRSAGLLLPEASQSVSARGKEGQEFATFLEKTLDEAILDLQAAQDSQSREANHHRQDHTLRQGDMVFLSTKALPLAYGNQRSETGKFQHRFTGPYSVVWVRGTAAKLDMGDDIHVHNVFHVSRLRHDTTDYGRTQQIPPPLRIIRRSKRFSKAQGREGDEEGPEGSFGGSEERSEEGVYEVA
jgi:hypothetical protein